jgi:hypothetical protein
MVPSAQQAFSLVALAAIATLLNGCTVGTQEQNCDGEACSCTLNFDSFWARIRISGVPIEHASRIFEIPDVAKDVKNASVAPCCSAIFNQIDYDEGKKPDDPTKLVSNFSKSCAASPNHEIASVAKGNQITKLLEKEVASKARADVRRLRKSEDAAQFVASGYEPIPDGEEGQDCWMQTSGGFNLSTTLIKTGSMKLRIRWVDNSNTQCCDPLKKVLQNVYFDGVAESDLSKDTKANFCYACKSSPNQGIALAAYRCFGSDVKADVSV